MASPKSGNAGYVVYPIEPKMPYEADYADWGRMAKCKVEQKQGQYGKYGSRQEKPYQRKRRSAIPDGSAESEQDYSEESTQKSSWIEVELVDEDGKPVPGEPFKITLPDGSVY